MKRDDWVIQSFPRIQFTAKARQTFSEGTSAVYLLNRNVSSFMWIVSVSHIHIINPIKISIHIGEIGRSKKEQ